MLCSNTSKDISLRTKCSSVSLSSTILQTFPLHVAPAEIQEKYVALERDYLAKRANVNVHLPRMGVIADKYGGNDATAAFLEATGLPDYSHRRPNFFQQQDYLLFADGMQQLIGHITVAKQEDVKKLCHCCPVTAPASPSNQRFI